MQNQIKNATTFDTQLKTALTVNTFGRSFGNHDLPQKESRMLSYQVDRSSKNLKDKGYEKC